jgi:hypothetical protein
MFTELNRCPIFDNNLTDSQRKTIKKSIEKKLTLKSGFTTRLPCPGYILN